MIVQSNTGLNALKNADFELILFILSKLSGFFVFVLILAQAFS